MTDEETRAISARTIMLCRTTDDRRVINKTLTNTASYGIRATHSLDILSPVIELDYDSNILTKNYAQISSFNRYYFISDIKTDIGKKIILYLTVDPLMSFASSIMNCPAMITRLEDKGAPTLYPDNKLPVIPGVEKVESTIATNSRIRTVIPGLPDNGYIITTVNGGVIST